MLNHALFAFWGKPSTEGAMDFIRRFIVAAAIASPIGSAIYLVSMLPSITGN